MALRKPWKTLAKAFITTLVFSSQVSSMAQEQMDRFGGFAPLEGTVWFVVAADKVIDNLGTDDSLALQEFIRMATYRRDRIFPGLTHLGLPKIIEKSLDELTSSFPIDVKWFTDTEDSFIRYFTLNGPNDLDEPWEELCRITPNQNKWDSHSGHVLDISEYKRWKSQVSALSGKVMWEKTMVKSADDVAQSDMPWAHQLAFLLLDSSKSDLENYVVRKNRGALKKAKKQLEYWFATFSVGPTKNKKIQISATSFRLRLEKDGVYRDMYTFSAELQDGASDN